MNLRVNLIDEHEIRDCRIVTARFLGLLVGGLIVAVILIVLGGTMIASQRQASALKEETWKWERIKVEFKHAETLAARRQAIERMAADLEGWRTARHSWRDELTAIASLMPETLQLTDLRMTSEITLPPDAASAKPPELGASLRLIGKTSSPTAEADVKRLRDAFSFSPYSNSVASAVIPQGAFRQDPSGSAGSTGRLFEVLCAYRVKTLK